MENINSIIAETVTATLAAIHSSDHVARAENAPVTRLYRKHVIWLNKRSDEAGLNVVVHAELSRAADCNQVVVLPSKLMQTPSGYYRLDYPVIVTSKVACPVSHVETLSLTLADNRFAYCSKTPIVIHAHEDIQISYEVQERMAEAQPQLLEPHATSALHPTMEE